MACNKVVFESGSNAVVIIVLTKDTAISSSLLRGYMRHDKAGNQIIGTNTFDQKSILEGVNDGGFRKR